MTVAVWCALLVTMFSHDSVMTDPGGMLYPRESETREVTSLDGLWNFRLSPSSDHRMGFDQFWHKKDLAEVCIQHFFVCILIKINSDSHKTYSVRIGSVSGIVVLMSNYSELMTSKSTYYCI